MCATPKPNLLLTYDRPSNYPQAFSPLLELKRPPVCRISTTDPLFPQPSLPSTAWKFAPELELSLTACMLEASENSSAELGIVKEGVEMGSLIYIVTRPNMVQLQGWMWEESARQLPTSAFFRIYYSRHLSSLHASPQS